MLIKNATYYKSINDLNQCPHSGLQEYAFIGRSNVGKSSLINLIAGKKTLAKTSSTPGKTRSINYFLINDAWYLVDLPGYGWAQVSKQQKAEWDTLVQEYLLKRSVLNCLFILVDSRLEPQPIDIEFVNWAGRKNIPLSLVFTKADKVPVNTLNKNKSQFLKVLSKDWEELPAAFVTSAVDWRGRDDLLDYIGSIIENIG